MLTRRHFIITSAAMFSPAIAVPGMAEAASTKEKWAMWDAEVTPPGYDPAMTNPWGLLPRYLPRRVETRQPMKRGDIHVDAVARFLYHIENESTAMRYGVAIARGNLYIPGVYTIKRKAKWPGWTPTQSMIERDPDLYAEFAGGMPPGPENPLGSRAFYLYAGSRDTYLRIHGTPEASTIGGRASSGCVRMVMAHINDLYENVDLGVTAHLYPTEVTFQPRG